MMGSISENRTEFGKMNQPHLEGLIRYFPFMEQKPDPRHILRDNVLALMRHRFGEDNISRLQRETGVSLGTLSRIKAAETSVGLELIDQIATKYGLMTWQLLVPGFDPAHPPVLQFAGLSEAQWYKVLHAAQTIAQYGSQAEAAAPSRSL